MILPEEWVKDAVKITCGFETTGDPYIMVAGDFDAMGISCGALQWNIGMNSLQPMVRAVGNAVTLAAMPTLGAEMWNACNTTVAKGLSIVRKWQSPDSRGIPKLNAVAQRELSALMGTPEMRREQDSKIAKKAATAFDMATDWAKARDQTKPSKRLFCWMFDTATQNGSLEGQTPTTVRNFITANTPDKVDDLICDYLAGQTGTGHKADARRNAVLWRNQVSGEQLELLCLSYLRSSTANPKWRVNVVNRKGTVSVGTGWVNSTLRDFSALLK